MFKPSSRTSGSHPAFEYPALMTDSEACYFGEALVLSSGRLTKCGAAETPEFIAQQAVAASASPTVKPAVARVDEMQEWDTVFSADGSSINVGDKVTIDSDGLRVTATTSSGVFEVSGKDALSTAGYHVTGYFRR